MGTLGVPYKYGLHRTRFSQPCIQKNFNDQCNKYGFLLKVKEYNYYELKTYFS